MLRLFISTFILDLTMLLFTQEEEEEEEKPGILNTSVDAHQHLLAAWGWKAFKDRWICVWCSLQNLSLGLCFQGDRKGIAVVCPTHSENSALCLAPWEFTQSAVQEDIWHFVVAPKCQLDTRAGGINGKLEDRLRIWSDFGSWGDPEYLQSKLCLLL